ncbi:MAG: right-handed parallel beta-helix repeat-containing protein [Chitinophagaceae bacterium]|nr:right-handed parallel beta-helix repeat-containing protein [Chitinophagaceae bacterium]
MKKIFPLLFFLSISFGGQAGRKFYIATNGNNNNAGTFSQPWKSWEAVNGKLIPGDTVFIRGGYYRSEKGNGAGEHCAFENLQGTAIQRVVITNYGIEAPVFNLDNISPTNSDPTGLIIRDCQFLTLRGLRITGLKQKPSGEGVSRGIDLQNSPNNILEFIEVDHIGGYGFILSNGSDNNYFLNCDAHHLDDRFTNDGGAWGNANGFQCTGGSTATNCTFESCRAWWISDDGFDFYGVNGSFTLKNCWAFWNGYEPGTFTPRGDGDGFKLGPGAGGVHNTLLRSLYNCVSFENKGSGFDQNNGDMRYRLYNNTSFKNGFYGYMWDYISPAPVQDFKNNVSFMDSNPRRGNETTGSNNSWNGFTITAASFKSILSTGADGPRGVDGSLPVLDFLNPSANSILVNAGIDVGLPFTGSAPDLGAFESNFGGVNELPVITAVGGKITLPTNSITISSTATDTDGYIVSYLWEKITGPKGGKIVSPNSAITVVNKLQKGRYKFRITATDNQGGKAIGEVMVWVNAMPIIRSFSIPSNSMPAE